MKEELLKLFYFLVYVEMILLLFVIFRHLVGMIISLIIVISKIDEWKGNIVMLFTEIPMIFFIILLSQHLVQINTSDSSFFTKLVYILSSGFLIMVFRLMYHGDVYEISNKRRDYLLYYHSKKFFKITYWIYFFYFIIMSLGVFDTNILIVNQSLELIYSILKIKYIGWLIPWFSIVLIIGSVRIGIRGSLRIIRSNEDFINNSF